MDWKSEYQRWMNYEGLEPRLRQELEQADDLPDRFYRDLESAPPDCGASWARAATG